ncbi:glycoside hydrolase family 13 protein [Nocardioides aurantiacus]|uniref:glycoside hydrolase family 13 protein n=1 Tax=Nocardioides aurantiacus TaxID=86796 RepID=UPI00403F8C37
MTSTHARAAWWRDAVVYEIYPRSFRDLDGDGVGDLRGITAGLPYLADLGVDAVWIAPWYPSPLADGGYDISDYRAVHPDLGTLDDAGDLLAEARRLGLRVITDLVANHTSSQHPWFVEALAAGPGSPERERYVFRDGRGEHGELAPNNWISAFGGGAWTRTEDAEGRPGQWYLHTFAPEQPDLDWGNEAVQADFDDVLRFWLDLGVDGFRVDAAPAMVKKPGLPDATYSGSGLFAAKTWVDNPHWDVDGVHAIFRRWRGVLDTYDDRVFVAETVVSTPERLALYLRGDELHTAFNFDFVHAPWDVEVLRDVITRTLTALAPVDAPPTWVLSSHDEERHLTRFGRRAGGGEPDLARGTARAAAAALLMLGLPGSTYLYQGEELGLPEVLDLPADSRTDPIFFRSGGAEPGRDGCRVPLPWTDEPGSCGFSPAGVSPWLPQPTGWGTRSAATQRNEPGSMLRLYRDALHLRRRLLPEAADGLEWLPGPDGVLHLDRGSFRCLVNLGPDPVGVTGTALISSAPIVDGRLPADAAAWLR